MSFAHEILDDYDKVLFFDPFNSDELCEFMIKITSLALCANIDVASNRKEEWYIQEQ